LICCLNTVAPLQSVFASGEDEGLLAAKAPFLGGATHSRAEFLGWKREIALDPAFSHGLVLLFFPVAHLWRNRAKAATMQRTHLARLTDPIARSVATFLYVPMPTKPINNPHRISQLVLFLVLSCPE
jgi:hypothetical protein